MNRKGRGDLQEKIRFAGMELYRAMHDIKHLGSILTSEYKITVKVLERIASGSRCSFFSKERIKQQKGCPQDLSASL